MRLSDFIRANIEAVEKEWEAFATTLQPAEGAMTRSELRDHASEILKAIADDLDQPESRAEQQGKSKGEGHAHRMGRVGKVHADLRIGFGFKLDQLVAEYRALRASVLRLWGEQQRPGELEEVTRFNEALTVSTSTFSSAVERYRDQFLGVLAHDLRSPLAAVKALASTLSRAEELSDKHARLASRIVASSDRMERMVGDLLDLTRTHLGGGIPISRRPMELVQLCRTVVEELRGCYPDRLVTLEAGGELHGEWDHDRLAQVVSNLVGNALQYSERPAPVAIALRDEGDAVRLAVHNQGAPIAASALRTLFDPLVRHGAPVSGRSSSLGLGLYIARELVISHGGGITVKSTEAGGTTFEVTLPRRAAAVAAAGADDHRPDPGGGSATPPAPQ